MHTRKQVSSEQIKNIFVDLDETLIHTNTSGRDYPNEIPEVTVKADKVPYSVSPRPGANDLLFALRSVGNVYMLTRATRAYALEMNKQFNFAFTLDRIYSRKDVEAYRQTTLDINKGKNYLIDDLPQYDNYEKISLLSHLGPVKYIRIKAFYGFKEEALTKSEIESIVSTILND